MFKFEYLNEYELIIQNILGYESGDQQGAFVKKKTEVEISCMCTFEVKQFLYS